MRRIVLLVHNVRSTHNVGSLLRTSDGFGIEKVYLCGYTPYPTLKNDSRLPHLQRSISQRIHKTALGAEQSVVVDHTSNIKKLIRGLKNAGFTVAALEQTLKAKELTEFKAKADIALLVGEETKGLPKELLVLTDLALEIPMLGQKESFNVAVAAAIALYHLRYQA